MNIQESVVFVTGANRGIGKAYVEALVQAGVRCIYASARNLATLNDVVEIAPDLIIPIALDITDSEQVNTVAQTAQDVTLLINNVDVIGSSGLFIANSVETAQWEMTTNYFGTLSVIRAFAPILQRNGGGAIVNMLSVVSVANAHVFSSYSAVETAMTEGVPGDKADPGEVAKAVLQAIETGIEDVYPDPVSQSVFSAIAEPLKAVEKQFAGGYLSR